MVIKKRSWGKTANKPPLYEGGVQWRPSYIFRPGIINSQAAYWELVGFQHLSDIEPTLCSRFPNTCKFFNQLYVTVLKLLA